MSVLNSVGQKGEQIRVVMLDDQVEVYERIADSLVGSNIETYFATTVEQAKRFVASQKPNVILSDIFLGADDSSGKGLEFLDYVVSGNETFYVPVIMYSGDSRRDYSTNEQAYKLGAEAYLRKPHNHHELISTIQKAASNYSVIQQALASQFIVKNELKRIFQNVPLTYNLNVALIASQRSAFAAYNYLKKNLAGHDGIKLTIFETAHSFYESISGQEIAFDAVVSCIPDLVLEPVIDQQCVASIYYFPNYRDVMSNGNFDYHFYWDNRKNPTPLFNHIALAVRNFRRLYRLKNELMLEEAI